jgi:NADH-quinone oxidoreductase subunit C
MPTADVVAALQEQFPGLEIEPRPLCTYLDGRTSGQEWVRIASDRLIEVCEFLRHDSRTMMEQVCDLTCIDYLNYPDADDRFAVIYSLLSVSLNHRLWLKVFVNDPKPSVPSVTGIWRGANWMEREVYDMFGVEFAGHPDLRRILCPDWFADHALRKDYPLRGKGEREDYQVLDRDSA